MNTSWQTMSISDSMRLTYADFKRLPRNDKRMLLQQLPYEDFVSLTTVLRLPVSTETQTLEEMTLEELISKQRKS